MSFVYEYEIYLNDHYNNKDTSYMFLAKSIRNFIIKTKISVYHQTEGSSYNPPLPVFIVVVLPLQKTLFHNTIQFYIAILLVMVYSYVECFMCFNFKLEFICFSMFLKYIC